jgi:hypothetical protein
MPVPGRALGAAPLQHRQPVTQMLARLIRGIVRSAVLRSADHHFGRGGGRVSATKSAMVTSVS